MLSHRPFVLSATSSLEVTNKPMQSSRLVEFKLLDHFWRMRKWMLSRKLHGPFLTLLPDLQNRFKSSSVLEFYLHWSKSWKTEILGLRKRLHGQWQTWLQVRFCVFLKSCGKTRALERGTDAIKSLHLQIFREIKVVNRKTVQNRCIFTIFFPILFFTWK